MSLLIRSSPACRSGSKHLGCMIVSNNSSLLLLQQQTLPAHHSYKSAASLVTHPEGRNVGSQRGFSTATDKKDPSFRSSGEASLWSRIVSFPAGVQVLFGDCRTYFNIEAARKSRSPNAWSQTGVPRQQVEQQRKVLQDLQIALPTVAGFWIPVIGSGFAVLGLAFPRWLLSRQFHSPKERAQFCSFECQERSQYWNSLSQHFKEVTGLKKIGSSITTYDKAGPVLSNVVQLYEAFELAKLDDLNNLPRDFLSTLALSSFSSRFPNALAFYTHMPTMFLIKHKVTQVARDIYLDDALLLQEGHEVVSCSSLTDDEVMDASLLRGLPIADIGECDEMRTYLTNHLKIVAPLHDQSALPTSPEQIHLGKAYFTLFIPAIRHSLKAT